MNEEVDGVYWLDPDGPTGARDPFPAFCDMNDEADFGVTVRNKSTKINDALFPYTILRFVFQVINHNKFLECERASKLKYDHVSTKQLRKLIDVSTYCSQEVYYDCKTGNVERMGNTTGWLDREKTLVEYWGGNTGQSVSSTLNKASFEVIN